MAGIVSLTGATGAVGSAGGLVGLASTGEAVGLASTGELVGLLPTVGVGEGSGAGLAATTPVGVDVAFAEPVLLVAVARTRSVYPASASVRRKPSVFADGTSTQLAPAASHRSHWNRKVIGSAPPHVPLLAARASPTWAVPVITGGVRFEGGASGVPVSTINWGARAASSRLPRDFEEVLLVVIARVIGPDEVMSGVTSRLTHCPERKPPEDTLGVEAIVGAVL